MNRLIAVIIVFCLTHSSEAQSELSVSLKGGPNAAVWDREHHNHHYGFSGGLAGDLLLRSFGTRFSLGGQLALLYMPRGTEAIDPTTGGLLARFRQHYLDVSVTIRPAARFGSARFYLLLGGSWCILLSANAVDSIDRKDDVTDLLRRHDVALLAGVGGAFHLPSRGLGPFRLGTLFLEARYDRGLIDIDPADDNVAKNRTTSLMLGLSFTLGSSTAATSRDPAGTAGTAASLTK